MLELFDRPHRQSLSLRFRSPDTTFRAETHQSFKREYNIAPASAPSGSRQGQWGQELWENRRAAFSEFAKCMKTHHKKVHVNPGTKPSECL